MILLGPLRIASYLFTSRWRTETNRLLAQLPAGASPGELITEVERRGGRLQSLEIGHDADRRTVLLDVALPPRADAPRIIGDLAELENVLEIRWTD